MSDIEFSLVDLHKEKKETKAYEHLSFKMNENDDPNEIAVLYYAFGHLKQSLMLSLQHLVGEEKQNVGFYIKILDRWMNDLQPAMKNIDVRRF